MNIKLILSGLLLCSNCFAQYFADFKITASPSGVLASNSNIGWGFSDKETPVIKLRKQSDGKWPPLASETSRGVTVEAVVKPDGSIDIFYTGKTLPGLEIIVKLSSTVDTTISNDPVWSSIDSINTEPLAPTSSEPPVYSDSSIMAIPSSFLAEIYDKYTSAKDDLNKLSSKVRELESELKSLSNENKNLKSLSVLTAWPTDGWVFYEPFGWVYLSNNLFPYFWINQPNFNLDYEKFDLSSRHDFDLKLNGWCYLDASSEDILIYCFNTSSWYNFK